MHPTPLDCMNGAPGVPHWLPFMAESNGPASMTEKNNSSARKGWNDRQELNYIGFKNHFKYYCPFQNFNL